MAGGIRIHDLEVLDVVNRAHANEMHNGGDARATHEPRPHRPHRHVTR